MVYSINDCQRVHKCINVSSVVCSCCDNKLSSPKLRLSQRPIESANCNVSKKRENLFQTKLNDSFRPVQIQIRIQSSVQNKRPIQVALLHLLVQFLVSLHRPDLSSARPCQGNISACNQSSDR